MLSHRFAKWVFVAFGLVFMQAVQAQETAEKGRAVLNANKDAVVTVRTVLKMTVMGNSNEMVQECTGTVLDESGLTVLSLSNIDPTEMLRSMTRMSGQDFEVSSEITGAEILREDGSELEAKVVLRDKHLDLAFVRPRETLDTPMAHVDISTPGKPQLLDQLVVLNRLGKVARRTHSASIEWVEAIVDKPRTFYIPGTQPTHSALGSPAFTLDGAFVGVLVTRTIQDDSGGSMFGMFGGGNQNTLGIIVPVDDIMEGAQQAPPAESTDGAE